MPLWKGMTGIPSARPQKHVPGNPAGYHGIVAAETVTKFSDEGQE